MQRAKERHRHSWSAAELEARELSDPRGPAEQTNRPEQDE
jgi:hypothetical protein